MTKLNLLLSLLFLSCTLSAMACNEVDIKGVDTGSNEYWCLVSGGTWDTKDGSESCFCDDKAETPCAIGAVCINENDTLKCSDKATLPNSSSSTPNKSGNENEDNS